MCLGAAGCCMFLLPCCCCQLRLAALGAVEAPITSSAAQLPTGCCTCLLGADVADVCIAMELLPGMA